jgi:hypothetical protein
MARGYDSLDAAWSACDRGDWMLWLLGRVSGAPESEDRKRLVLCACACARTALPFVRSGEERPLRCIETAERWARGEATIGEVREARRAAAAAAAAAAYAADAADAADAAAYAAAAAAAAAYAADARSKALKACADIVRAHYPQAPVLP